MKTQQLTNVVLPYFAGFAEKNLTKITENFHPNIVLSDWNGTWESVTKVSETIKKMIAENDIYIFPSSLHFSYLSSHSANVICVLDLWVNEKTRLDVVDVISLMEISDSNWMITKVEAYKK